MAAHGGVLPSSYRCAQTVSPTQAAGATEGLGMPCVPPRPGEQVFCFSSGAGAYPAALAKYQEIHKARPENVECLRYLLHIYTEMGHKEEVQEYAVKLRKAERAAQEATTRAPQVSEPPLTRRRGGLGVGVGLGTRAVSDGSAARGDRPTSPICTSRCACPNKRRFDSSRVVCSLGQGTVVEAPTQGYYAPPSEPTIRPGLAAPAPLEHFKAPDRAAGRTVQAGLKREEDEWGSGMLGDDLLPGM